MLNNHLILNTKPMWVHKHFNPLLRNVAKWPDALKILQQMLLETLRFWNAIKCAHLTLFFMGEGKCYPAKIFLLILKNYRRQTFGLPQFLGEPNFVLKVFWKLQINNVTISTLTATLWSDVIRCFLKKNNKNNKDK